jgi:hypothetical protein
MWTRATEISSSAYRAVSNPPPEMEGLTHELAAGRGGSLVPGGAEGSIQVVGTVGTPASDSTAR